MDENHMNMEPDSSADHQPYDEQADEHIAYVDMNDVIEVQVDEDAPMADDDDNDIEASLEGDGVGVEDMCKVKIEAHSDAVYSITGYVENGVLFVLSGGGDDKAFCHKVTSNISESKKLNFDHKDTVSCVAHNLAYVSSDLNKTPRLAAVGSYDGTIVLYDPDTAEQKLKLEGPSDVEWVNFHPKGGSVLLAGSGDGTVWMFHIPLNRCLQVFVGHEQAVTAGCFSPDGKWALTASSDGTLRIWAPKTGMNKHVFRLGEAGLTCLATNGGSDGMLVLVGSEDGSAHVCHIGTKKVVTTLRHFEAPLLADASNEDEMEYPMSLEAVGFCPFQKSWCATGGIDGRLKIWDLAKDGQCRHTCVPPGEENDSITRLSWHPKLPVVFTSHVSGVIRLWDARSGSLVSAVTGHTETINDFEINVFDSGIAVIVSAGDDKTIRVFEADVNAILQQASSVGQMDS